MHTSTDSHIPTSQELGSELGRRLHCSPGTASSHALLTVSRVICVNASTCTDMESSCVSGLSLCLCFSSLQRR